MFTTKRIWLDRDPHAYQQWKHLMQQAHLNPEESVDYTLGIYAADTLIASGSYTKNIIKYLAVHPDYQAENLLAQLISALIQSLHENQQTHLFIYTKPMHAALFASLGFQTIVATEDVLFMEQGKPNLADYLAFLQTYQVAGTNSAIVMNANPFTKGHQYLVEQAAKQSTHVYLFVVSEDCSTFSTKDRMAMVTLGVAHLPNVTVLPTRDYMVSAATFPAYFLKEHAPLAAAKTQARMDAQLFMEQIAPILNIRMRFVGEEPFSEVTQLYNQTMQAVFKARIRFVILPRIRADDETISATKVRKAIAAHDDQRLKAFLPHTTYTYLKKQQLARGEKNGH